MSVEHNDEIFDYAGLAAYLKIAHGTPRHWVSAGKIPHFKLGSRVTFFRKEIDAWFLTHKYHGKQGGGETDRMGKFLPPACRLKETIDIIPNG